MPPSASTPTDVARAPVLDGRREARQARLVLGAAAVVAAVLGLGTGISPYIALLPVALADPVCADLQLRGETIHHGRQ